MVAAGCVVDARLNVAASDCAVPSDFADEARFPRSAAGTARAVAAGSDTRAQRLAKRKVEADSGADAASGDSVATSAKRAPGPSASRSSRVSAELRNGTCDASCSSANAATTFPSAAKLALMARASRSRAPADAARRFRSEPARSTSRSTPAPVRTAKIAWLRDETAFSAVSADARRRRP